MPTSETAALQPPITSLLPAHASLFEQHLEQAGSFADLPIDNLSDFTDPWTIDVRFLPWLAYRFGLEIWHDDWSEQKKRSVIARALDLQRTKGTEKGLRDYVDLADAEVQQIVVPPQYFWAANAISKQEIDAWHATLPQIRVYEARETRSAKGFSFANHGNGPLIATPDIGRALYGRKARLWDQGQETPLQLVELHETNAKGEAVIAERVSLPGKAGRTFFANGFAGACYCEAQVKAPELLTWNRNLTYSYPTMTVSTTQLRPGLQPVDLRVQQISDPWQDNHAFAASRIANGFFAMPDQAPNKLYDCLVLNDPQRAAPRVKGLSFANVTMLGMPSFTARVLIDLQEKRIHKAFYADESIVNYHVAADERPEKRRSVDRAVTLSKAARDRIFVSHQTSRPITFGDVIPFDGSIKFNSRIKNRL